MARPFLNRAVACSIIAIMAIIAPMTPMAWAQTGAPASASPAPLPSSGSPSAAPAVASDPASLTGQRSLTEAEVRRIDAAGGRITLRHGPIPNLDMPAMTMPFQVKDPALLQGLKEGSRIRFAAEKIDGQYTVTVVQPAP